MPCQLRCVFVALLIASAQLNAQSSDTETEPVIVTGSHLPTAEEVGPNPILEIDRQYIEKSGQRTAEQLLRDLPIANANGVPISNNGIGFASGASSISLRGFDASATLVLIDGRRVAPYPIGTGDGTQAFIDLNSISLAAIESIEILKDGASTVYGADAVAGVVNIKLRHDYRGAQTSVEYGNTLDKDNGEFAASVLFGTGDGTTNLSGVMSYYHRNAILNHDRGYSNFAFNPSSNSSPGNFQISRDAAVAAGVLPDQLPDRNIFYAVPPDFTNGLAPPTEYGYHTSRVATFNFNAFAGSFPESERYGGFVNFDHKVFADQLVIYADFLYENAHTLNQLAPSPTGIFAAPGQIPIAIPPHAPGMTVGGPSYEETGVMLGAFNPFNPFQQIISGGSRYRLVEFPNRIIDNTTDAFLTTLGIKGDKLFGGTWGYDMAFRYSQVKDTAMSTLVSRSRLNRVFNAADPIFDPNSREYIGTTIPYNPFGDYRVPIASNTRSITFASAYPKDLETSKLATVDFNLYTTSLFQFPAGGVGLAIGGQFRREGIIQKPDDSEIEGDIAGFTSKAIFTAAGRKSYGLYAESDIPFFSSANAVPGLHALEFTASARFEDYLNNDTNILIPKVGMRWQPFDESVTIRSTWGEGFREPSLFELYTSPSVNFFDFTDPLTGVRDTETPFVLNGNPNLAPEDSRNFTAGIVWTPKFALGLTATIDLFDIERHDVVSAPNPHDIVRRELKGKLLPGEMVLRDADGFITSIIGPYENNGGETARGADFGLQYELQTSFGTFTSLTQATWLDSFREALSRGAPALEFIRRLAPFSIDDAFLKWKGKSRLDWSWRNFDLNVTLTYTDGFHEKLYGEALGPTPQFPNGGLKEHWVDATWVIDGQASYNFRFSSSAGANISNDALAVWQKLLDGTTVTLGCNNVFSQDPPLSFFGAANYPGFIYDSIGRFVYVSLKKTF